MRQAISFSFIALALACFALSPTARAVKPPPDGGYPNQNTAEGAGALFSLTTGHSNTAMGFNALYTTTDGFANTATGTHVLENNDGHGNTGNGVAALQFNTTGSFNTATGGLALFSNTTGILNTADGYLALISNETGLQNTATGASALRLNTTGNYNTADGREALRENTTGNFNIRLGYFGGYNLTTGGDNNIDIGNQGVDGESNTIRIGEPVAVTNADNIVLPAHTATFIAGISGTAVTGVAVRVSSSGQLGTAPSSKRFKDEIKPMDKASEAILALKPVSFRYKHEVDPEGIPQFGLVAEEVEKVNPALVARDAQGKVYTVRYEAVNAMLLNEFLKEHSTVQELKSTAAKQRATIAQQQKDLQSTATRQENEIKALTVSLKEQASQIQKVSAQLEVSKPAPQMVLNNQ